MSLLYYYYFHWCIFDKSHIHCIRSTRGVLSSLMLSLLAVTITYSFLRSFLILYFNHEINILPLVVVGLDLKHLIKVHSHLRSTCKEIVAIFKDMNEKAQFHLFWSQFDGQKNWTSYQIYLLRVLYTMRAFMEKLLPRKAIMKCVLWCNLKCIYFSSTAPRIIVNHLLRLKIQSWVDFYRGPPLYSNASAGLSSIILCFQPFWPQLLRSILQPATIRVKFFSPNYQFRP